MMNNIHRNTVSTAQRLAITCIILFSLVGSLTAQSNGRFVIKREISGTTHYLAHVKNGSTWELQDATMFSPNCLWISDNTYTQGGANKNYYFYDEEETNPVPRFLSAPDFAPFGEITLSTSLPPASHLNNPEQQYYFYQWDNGLGRGVQYLGVTEEECNNIHHGWNGTECWEVYWVEYNTSQTPSKWRLSEKSYDITANGGKFSSVAIIPHAQDTTATGNTGLSDLSDFEIELNESIALNSSYYSVTTPYTFSYIPEHTEYVFDGVSHYYYNNSDHTTAPGIQNGSVNVTPTYQWTLSGEGASYLSLSSTTAANPTLTYNNENNTGHKTATLTLTVTYGTGANAPKQTKSATVTVLTPCGNPSFNATPNEIGATITWVPTADSYLISWKKTIASTWNSVTVGNVTSYSITGLEYGFEYEYKVQATSCTTADPTPKTFTTLADPGLLVAGAIFGGGRMANVGGKTEVVIINCSSIDAVYGGNDIAGAVEDIDGSTIVLGVNENDPNTTYDDDYGFTKANLNIGSVYGGGNGYYAYNGSSFVAASSDYASHTVAVGGQVKAMTPAHKVGDAVWTNTGTATKTLDFPSIVKSKITVTNDFVKVDSIFGGAKNAFMTHNEGTNQGNTIWSYYGSSVIINGGTAYAVFGGNNWGGTQGYGWHLVQVNGTKTELTENIVNTADTGYGRDFGIRYVFGGGNRVAGSTTDVQIKGGQSDYVFAGGNAADIYKANVTVQCSLDPNPSSGGITFGTVYSSGIASTTNSSITIKDDYAWDGKGIYNVRNLFGGNNEAPMTRLPSITLTCGTVGTVYGGGNKGDMLGLATDNGNNGMLQINGKDVKYGTHVVVNSPTIMVDYLYGGCNMSNVLNSTWVELKKGHVGTVYGGCNISGDVGSTRVYPDIEYSASLSTEDRIKYQSVVGGTYVQAGAGGDSNTDMVVYKKLFAGSNGYYNCSSDGIYYNSDEYYDDPTGQYAGVAIPTHNETSVIVTKGITVKGDVYAGGNLASVGFNKDLGSGHDRGFPDFVGMASVRMDGGHVEGNVYGGGNMASIYGQNEVRVSGGTIGLALYGGNDRAGKAGEINNRILPATDKIASDGHTSLDALFVKTYVKVYENAQIGTVYGGGNGAYNDNMHYCQTDYEPIQSNTFVDININGGSSGGHIGTVYGGGNGVTIWGGATVFVNIKEPSSTEDYDNIDIIYGGNNLGELTVVPNILLLHGQVGTVYGGCNQGPMNAENSGTTNQLVTVTSGSDSYTEIGSYVYLRSTYQASADYTHTVTAKVSKAIYGGCRMNGVKHNSLVLVENDSPTADLFGGSDISGTVQGTSRVVVKGGTVGNVYGGGNGNYTYNSNGDVYSGATQVATGITTAPICATSIVDIKGGQVGTSSTHKNVFGGGFGQRTSITGDVTVNFGLASATSTSTNPRIYGNVYGGSAFGNVNTDNTNKTTVNIHSGTLNDDVYGGGMGETDNYTYGKVNGVVEVNIGSYDSGTDTYSGCASFGSDSKVFGCNDAGGSPQDNVTVNIYSTAHTTGTNGNSYPDPVPTNADQLLNATSGQFALQAVYGGGNLANYAPENGLASSTKKTTVHIYQCNQNTIKDVYGGSNMASAQNTHVIIDGGRIDRTFGGGNGEAGPAPVVGTAKTDIYAGLITQVFGGSNNQGNIGTIDLNIVESTSCPELIYEVFSGSNLATLYGDVTTNLVGTCYNATSHPEPDGTYYYGGTNYAPLYGNVTLNVYGGYYLNVFGGSRGYLHPTDPTQSISADIKRFPTQDEVNNAPANTYPQEMLSFLNENPSYYGKGGNVTLNIYGGKIDNAYGGSNMLGNIEGKITVNVLEGGGDSSIDHCPLDLFNVYGSGNVTAYTPRTDITTVGTDKLTPEVNILKGTVKNNVFGGGLGSTATVTANPVVTIGDLETGHEGYVATVGRRVSETINGNNVNVDYGNVYGGGELAQVVGSTKVLVQKANTKVMGTVYGGGMGSTNDPDDGLVTGNATVEMTNGNIQRSIYGGGEMGSVGTFTDWYTAGEDPLHVAGEPKEYDPNTGLTTVKISGGRVGMLNDNNGLMPNPNIPTTYDDYGYVFCASKGEADSVTYPTANLLAVVANTYLEISGSAVVTASAYGGSENGQVIDDTHVKITGGQIGLGHYKDKNTGVHIWDDPYDEATWTAAIDKIKNGTFTNADAATFHQCDAWPFGKDGERKVYDYYAQYEHDGEYYYDAAHTQSSHGGSNKGSDGHSFFGHVFGGGSGYYPFAPGKWRASAGRVCGNTYVEITGGHILSNVYGGNEISNVLGKSTVEMSGGTVGVPRSIDSIQKRPVNSYIFGAGMGDPRDLFNKTANVGSAEVIVKGNAVVFGSVFGGGEDGHVLGDAKTTIEGNALIGTWGTSGVDGNAFGGGRGFSALSLAAGIICGNVTLDIKDNALILGSVYGGGRMAAVGTHLADNDESNYGHLQLGADYGNITINISGGTIGNQYKMKDNNAYSIGDVFGGSKGILLNDPAKSQRLGLAKNATVNISQPSGKTTRIYGSIYGGGELATVGNFNYATAASGSVAVGDVVSLAETGTGVATINITGGTIGQPAFISTKGHVFGSCLGKAGTAYSGYSFVDQSHVTLSGDAVVYGSIFGGGENGHVLHDTDVKIKGGTVGIRLDDVTTLDDNMIFHGNVYGGGRGIDEVTEGGSTNYSITAGKVSGNTNVEVTGGLIYRNVYGGGSFASVGTFTEDAQGNFIFTDGTGTAYVTVTGGVIGTDGGKSAYDYSLVDPQREHRKENGFVFGSGRGVAGPEGSVYDHLAYTNNTVVTIGGTAYVTGSVFGGAENGHVKNNTTVTVNPGTGYFIYNTSDPSDPQNSIEPYPVIGYPMEVEEMDENLEKPRIIYRGNVYGGGRGIDPYNNGTTLSRIAGVVQNSTNVYVYGGTVRHDVYGGGSFASVGQYTYDAQGVLTGHVSGGTSTVTIDGGLIGMSPLLSVTQVANTLGTSGDNSHNLSGINNGQVFGGGRGESGLDSNGTPRFRDLAYVYESQVNIDQSSGKTTLVCGAVFGGGCNGHVETDSRVVMTGGEIGHELSEMEKAAGEDFVHPMPIYYGNVYGGGRGIDHTNLSAEISRTVGRVFGNTYVEISGGEVHHDVYGGGSLANVGTYTEDLATLNLTFVDGTGDTHITITGTAIIGTDGTDTRNAGFVYGSGRGMSGAHWSDMAFVNDTYVTIGTKNGTDNPQVKSSVFGGGSDGHVKGHTDVKVYTGTIGTPLTAAEMVEADPTDPSTGTRPRVYRGNVYGGGRGVERITSSSGTPELSHTAGHVYGNTNVLVEGGTIYHNIYGGGSLASVGTFTEDPTTLNLTFTPGTGKATVTITGGEIGMSPANAALVPGATQYFSGMNSGQVYGSGRGEAGVQYADMAFTNETEVNVSGGNIYGAVFGGGANGHVKAHTLVNISGGNIGFDDGNEEMATYSVYRGNVYGGGRGIDIDTEDSGINISPTAGKVYGNTEVNITGGVIYHNVFGGGSLASVGTITGTAPNLTFADNTGKTTINISGGQIGTNTKGCGRVFGAGRGYPHPELVAMTYVDKTEVNVFDGADIRGAVFGSGDNGQVYTEARINMSGGTVGTTDSDTGGSLFGSGRGVDTYDVSGTPTLNPISGRVYGDTYVTMTGGQVKFNVYGGGFMASVGRDNLVNGTTHVNIGGSSTVGLTGSTVPTNYNGGKVFGGSHGDSSKPELAKVNHTVVNVYGAEVQIQDNVYGGGENGAVEGNTNVTVSNATLHDVYGAGQGDETIAIYSGVNANIGGSTTVNINSGTINNVYGGGQNGTVAYQVETSSTTYDNIVSTVNINGGTIKNDVYGGGDQGTTQGQIIVNLKDGIIQNELFGGAKGSRGKVYVAGLKTVNTYGGSVFNHVYGGSRNANDAQLLSANTTNSADANVYTAFVNVCGGLLRGDVYGAGYYGHMFGSSDVNIGRDAIKYANSGNINKGSDTELTPAYLHIIKNVYAGSNWGEYNPAVPFGSSTTTGYSNVYVDGDGYDTETLSPPANIYTSAYMELGGSVYGSGTSSDAGTQGRKVQVANYGHPILANQTLTSFDGANSKEYRVLNSSTRSLQSIQRCDNVILDDVTIKFTGQGDISQNYNTVEYAFMYVDKGLYVRNGSNIITDVQIDEVHALYSEYRPNTITTTDDNGLYVANPITYWIGIGNSDYKFYSINGSTAQSLNDTLINTIRFNGGYALYVRYSKQYSGGVLSNVTPELFGELKGFFRMVTEDNNETFAHARPKLSSDNKPDGGFMSYYNEYHNNFTEDPGDPYTKGKQFPYINVIQRGDRPDYRYWRIRATNNANHMVSPMAFFLFSDPTSTEDFITIERTITLPTLECAGNSYYTLHDIDYGDHAHLVDAAINDTTSNTNYWMVHAGTTYNPQQYGPDGPASTVTSYYDQFVSATSSMQINPNTHFGLIIKPAGSIANISGNHEYLLSMDTRDMITEEGAGESSASVAKFDYPANPNGQMAKMTIRLTYYKEMSMSMALSPMTVTLHSYCVPDPTHPEIRELKDVISVPIYITTQTALGQNMTTTSYAMYGDVATDQNPETYNVKATLPPFTPIGVDVPFYVYNLNYSTISGQNQKVPTFETQTTAFNPDQDTIFTMVFKRGFNSDNKSGWREAIESATNNYFQIPASGSTFTPIRLGSTDGRTPSSIDFTLYYNSCKFDAALQRYTPNMAIGTLTYHICYPIAAEDVNLEPDPTNNANWAKFAKFQINIILFKKDSSKGFYLDGKYGGNLNTGAYANDGMKTLQGIIAKGWTPGDVIWVVRPVSNISTATWSSNNGAPIVMKRYPGKFVDEDHYNIDVVDPLPLNNHSFYHDHHLDNPIANTGVYIPDKTNPTANVEEDGAIFANINTKAHLVIDNIILDGYNYDAENPQMAPLIAVSGGGTVTIKNSCEIINSNNHQSNAMGSAVYVGDEGNLLLMDGVNIHDNVVTNTTSGNGAAVYLDEGGYMQVGGLVTIKNNTVNGSTNVNNVYLYVKDNPSNKDVENAVIHIGEEGLDPNSVIGVTKTEFYESGDLKDLTPIATSIYHQNIHQAFSNNIFRDDTRKAYTHFFIENTLYYGKTWAHFVTNNDPDHPYDPDTNPEGVESGAFTVDATGHVTISSTRALAWFLSYVNGLNGSPVHENAQATLTTDVNLGEHYWKPVGIIEDGGCEHGFTGTFDGQWHTIDGVFIKREGFHNIGFFDNVAAYGTDNGVVKNVVLGSKDCQIYPWNPDPVAQYAGGLVGTVMGGGLVTACEAYPVMSAQDATTATVIGGVAGHVAAGGMVHSCIGMPTLTGYTMGGLVGLVNNGGQLVNSYSNIESMTVLGDGYSTFIGGLAGKVLSGGLVENCYAKLQSTATESNRFGWFVGQNGGDVNYCYAPTGKTNYIFEGNASVGHGNYDPLPAEDEFNIKAIGYMYDDNTVTLASGSVNPYYNETITYTDKNNEHAGHITGWPGMVSALNHWVDANYDKDNARKHFASWFRPMNHKINDDLPVLGMEDYNSVATIGNNHEVLQYGNLDDILVTLNAAEDSEHNDIESSLLVYGNATGVTHAPARIGSGKAEHAKVKVTVDEDAVLMTSTTNFEATVGVTFDNSWKKAHDFFSNTLEYDWHLMSTPLSNAPMGTDYNMSIVPGYQRPINLTKMENGYFPNGLPVMAYDENTDIAWDLYSYDEPDYHWINFKRGPGNHWHIDTLYVGTTAYPNPIIHSIENGQFDPDLNKPYENETTYLAGKGYMMGISKDSYMSNIGFLNSTSNPITIDLTTEAPADDSGTPITETHDRGSNLVGNPYQAYLDLSKLQTSMTGYVNGNLQGLYFYIADADGPSNLRGLYVPYTAAASPNPATPTQYLHPHQAFFVVTNTAGKLAFTPEMAGTEKEPSSFFRDERQRYPLVNLYVTDSVGNADLAIVEFNRPEVGGVKKIDNLRNADFKLYAHFNNEDYGLLFTPRKTARIPVFFKTPHDGTYTLTWRTHNGTFSTMRLIDNLTGTNYDMLTNDHYTFDASATDYAARFYIVFSLNDVEEIEEENEIFAYFNGDGWVVDGEGQLELVDMLGQVLYANHLSGEPTIVHFGNYAAGVYMLRLVGSNRVIKAQKIIIE